MRFLPASKARPHSPASPKLAATETLCCSAAKSAFLFGFHVPAQISSRKPSPSIDCSCPELFFPETAHHITSLTYFWSLTRLTAPFFAIEISFETLEPLTLPLEHTPNAMYEIHHTESLPLKNCVRSTLSPFALVLLGLVAPLFHALARVQRSTGTSAEFQPTFRLFPSSFDQSQTKLSPPLQNPF